jgi:hypothetical protein
VAEDIDDLPQSLQRLGYGMDRVRIYCQRTYENTFYNVTGPSLHVYKLLEDKIRR